MRHILILTAVMLAATASAAPIVPSAVDTQPMPSYDDAPGTPDADDPAIWVHPTDPARSLVIGTLKDAGLAVYNLSGQRVQTIAPPNLPVITSSDPATPAGLNETARPCAESEEGETSGRFNNVAVAQRVWLGHRMRDVAVVTDRGCDRLRIYEIAPAAINGPLIDITSSAAPRVFPLRYVQPSPIQPGELAPGLQENPIDEQDTAYGIGLWQRPDGLHAFVSQRNRSVVLQVKLRLDASGRVTYEPVRPFVFDPVFTLQTKQSRYLWTPCREGADEDPQSEGIVVDADRGLLYVALETIGVYRLSLNRRLPPVVHVGRESLMDAVTHFGQPYWAITDDDEFQCEYAPEGEPEADTLVAVGSDAFAGQHLEADVEGLAIYRTGPKSGYLLVSSQGDDTFHIYDRRGNNSYAGVFAVEGTGESDGVDVTHVPLGAAFPQGMLVVQNGEAEDPQDTSDVNGYEYDGSTQFRLVSWAAIEPRLPLTR